MPLKPVGVLAARAGMDTVLASGRNVTQGEAIVNALATALKAGTLDQNAFDQAPQRILSLRGKIQA